MKQLILFLLLVVFSAPVMAQSSTAPLSADEQKRLELSIKMHDVWPIRPRIESALDAIGQNFPEDKQAEVKASLRKSIQFNQLEEESTKAMAEIFTAEELQAMIDFYGSEVGKSISAKTSDYELALRPIMVKMIDKAMLDLRTGQGQ